MSETKTTKPHASSVQVPPDRDAKGLVEAIRLEVYYHHKDTRHDLMVRLTRGQDKVDRLAVLLGAQDAEREEVVAVLEELLTLQPRAVRMPGTQEHLAVSYTEADLLKMKTAQAVARAARGGAA